MNIRYKNTTQIIIDFYFDVETMINSNQYVLKELFMNELNEIDISLRLTLE